MIKSAQYEKNFYIITVDPGNQGAIVLSKIDCEDQKLKFLKSHTFDFCSNNVEVACLISNFCKNALKEAENDFKSKIIYAIEKPFPSPLNSRKSISQQFLTYGSTLLTLQIFSHSKDKVEEISPKSWVSEICTTQERKLKKEGRFKACERIFGKEILNHFTIKTKSNKAKLHHGIADAILMCAYIAKKMTKIENLF